MLLPPISTLFPYTTLFRSGCRRARRHAAHVSDLAAEGEDRIAQGSEGKDRRHCRDRLPARLPADDPRPRDRKSTRLNSSHSSISYAVFCLKKKSYIIDGDR